MSKSNILWREAKCVTSEGWYLAWNNVQFVGVPFYLEKKKDGKFYQCSYSRNGDKLVDKTPITNWEDLGWLFYKLPDPTKKENILDS